MFSSSTGRPNRPHERPPFGPVQQAKTAPEGDGARQGHCRCPGVRSLGSALYRIGLFVIPANTGLTCSSVFRGLATDYRGRCGYLWIRRFTAQVGDGASIRSMAGDHEASREALKFFRLFFHRQKKAVGPTPKCLIRWPIINRTPAVSPCTPMPH